MSMNANPTGYGLAKWVYEKAPNQLEKTVTKLGGGSDRAKWWGGFLKRQVDNDFCDFARMEAGGRFKALIAEPPRGALLFLLYPCTVGPRLYRAYQRGRKSNDYREVGDVMRRDIPAITFFVFALPAVVNRLSKGVQRASGVNLLDKTSNQVLRYSQFRNYELDLNNLADKPGSIKSVLKAILSEGNGESLKKAMDTVHFRGEKGDLSNAVDAMKATANGLVDQYHKALEGGKSSKDALAAVDSHLDTLLEHFRGIEKERNKVAHKAAKDGVADVAKAATQLKTDLSGALVKFAKERRLPSDFLSFAIVVGLIGWLPVTFNSMWNKRQFNKKQEAKKAAAAKAPAGTQPSRLMRPTVPFNGFHAQSAYSQLPAGSYAFRPQYGAQAMNNNPFQHYSR